MKKLPSLILICMSINVATGQGLNNDNQYTEEQLRASTKQVNQFFRRFNGEEDQNGKRYYPKDKKYRDPGLRKKYFPVLFDTESGQLDHDQIKIFIKKITDKKNPCFLDFHNDDWLAEVNATFSYNGRSISGLLFMRLQQQGQGYEWVIEDVAIDPLEVWYNKNTTEKKRFMHPMSHELGFMTLRKALKNHEAAEDYTLNSFTPDRMTVFLYELNQGNLEFKSVKKVDFHFFSIHNYYFSISYFNRPGFNSGWLISGLTYLENEDQKNQILDYLYGKN